MPVAGTGAGNLAQQRRGQRCAQHPAELRHGPAAEQLVRLAEIDQPEDAVLLPVERCESCVGLAAIEIPFPLFQKWNIVRQVCIARVDVCAVKIIERRQFSEKTEAGGAARLDQADRAVRTLAQRGTDARRRLVGQDEIRRYNVIRVHALLRIASPSQPTGRPRRSSPYSSGRMNTVQADGKHGRKLCASASISRAQRSPSFVAQSAAARASV